MAKQTPPLVKTTDKAIAVCGFDDEEQIEIFDFFIKSVLRATRKNMNNVWVLAYVIREIPRLKKGAKMGFDFGTKKEWELKRKK